MVSDNVALIIFEGYRVPIFLDNAHRKQVDFYVWNAEDMLKT